MAGVAALDRVALSRLTLWGAPRPPPSGARSFGPGPAEPTVATAGAVAPAAATRFARTAAAHRLGRLTGGERAGAAEEVPLAVVDAQGAQEIRCLTVLDELADNLGAEAGGHVGDGLDDQLVGLGVRQVADELAVDLDLVELEV